MCVCVCVCVLCQRCLSLFNCERNQQKRRLCRQEEEKKKGKNLETCQVNWCILAMKPIKDYKQDYWKEGCLWKVKKNKRKKTKKKLELKKVEGNSSWKFFLHHFSFFLSLSSLTNFLSFFLSLSSLTNFLSFFLSFFVISNQLSFFLCHL